MKAYRRLGHSLRVRTRLPRRPLEVVLDAAAVCQAIINVVENAAVHSGATEVEVRLKTQGEAVQIEAEDNGCGIPRSKHQMLFEPYTTLAPEGAHRGTGLGLFIARETVVAQGGDLTVQSKRGGPTIFRFTFPVS